MDENIIDENIAGDIDASGETLPPDEHLLQRMQILDRIDSGQISTDEGLRLLDELDMEYDTALQATSPVPPENPSVAFESTAADGSTVWETRAQGAASVAPEIAGAVKPEVIPTQRPFDSEDFARWRRYWMIPLWIGAGITVIGSILMAWAMNSGGFGFWFLCASLPFAVGVLLMVIAAQSRTAHWLHIRVRQPPGERPQKIAISFPIPIGLAAWFFRTFRHRIPGMEGVPQNIDELILAVRDGTTPDNPLYIEVDEDDGERVEIYIG
jgi:hypothetical protein